MAAKVEASVGTDGRSLTKSSVTMSGSSGVMVAADPNRLYVMVSSTLANDPAAIDPTGGTAALDSGIPLPAGTTIEISGTPAQSAMTQIGTNGQKLTIYTG